MSALSSKSYLMTIAFVSIALIDRVGPESSVPLPARSAWSARPKMNDAVLCRVAASCSRLLRQVRVVLLATLSFGAVFSSASAAVVNGVCGGDNGLQYHDTPSVNLCVSGTASAVVAAPEQFAWTCNGTNAGGNASCAAPRVYSIQIGYLWETYDGITEPLLVTAAPKIAYNATPMITIEPSPGFVLRLPVGGNCGGTLSGTSYTTSPVTKDCDVSAVFFRTVQGVANPPNSGTVTCDGPTVSGGGANCAVVPASGARLLGVTGCSGTLTGAAYQIASVSTSCRVTAFFEAPPVPALDPWALTLIAIFVVGFAARRLS